MKKYPASLIFIFIAATLDMVGMGIIIPSLPHIMKRFFTSDFDVSAHYGYFIALFASMQFLASPLLGAISDHFGRRPILLLSIFVAGLDYILMAFAPTLPILYFGRIISGLTSAGFTVAMAYVADISTDENRSKNFGLVGASFGLGFIIGPALGGILQKFGPEYPFLAAAVLNLTNLLFGYYVLPESLALGQRRNLTLSKLNPMQSILKTCRLPGIFSLAMAYFLFQLAGQTHPSIWILYTEKRYQWTSMQIGFSMALVGVLATFAQAYLTGLIVPRLGEFRSVVIGLFGYAISFVFFGLATKSWMIYFTLIVSSVFWITQPALQSLISRSVSPKEQGELQGSLVSFSSLASILNPLVTTQLFAAFSSSSTISIGMPYFFAAVICFFAISLVLRERNQLG